MPIPPNDAGILSAMKSMKAIAGKGNKASSFPHPPIDFVGTMGPAAATKKKKTLNKKKSVGRGAAPPKSSPVAIPPTTPLPPSKPDTNTQLFGTLVNSLKTCPVGQEGTPEPASTTTKKSRGGKNAKKKKNKPAVASSASSSSASVSSMSTRSPANSYTVSSGSSTLSVSEAGESSVYSSQPDAGKVAREKKKRKEELRHEKVEMLTRIANLAKNGFAATKEWGVRDDIDEIRYECYRMQRESNSKKSIKIMRRVLVTITTLVETGNAYFNPFNLRLEGFSESMMLNLDDYDDCFEQIHHKYSGRSSVGPEMQILFTFMSAAIFHHAGNAIGRPRSGDSASGKERRSSSGSPSPMSSVMSMMGMLSQNKPAPSIPTPVRPADASSDTDHPKPKRKTMRGPGATGIPASVLGSTLPSMTLAQGA